MLNGEGVFDKSNGSLIDQVGPLANSNTFESYEVEILEPDVLSFKKKETAEFDFDDGLTFILEDS